MTDKKLVKPVKPKNIPIKCPVCKGFGTLGYAQKTCHACNGKGYILVDCEEVKSEK